MDRAGAGARVEIDQHNLLPCANHQLPVHKGHSERRAQNRSADMRMPIIIFPACLMGVELVTWRDTLHHPRHILLQARLVLDRGHGCRRADHEHRCDAVEQPTLQDCLFHLPSDVKHVVVALRLHRELCRMDHRQTAPFYLI